MTTQRQKLAVTLLLLITLILSCEPKQAEQPQPVNVNAPAGQSLAELEASPNWQATYEVRATRDRAALDVCLMKRDDGSLYLVRPGANNLASGVVIDIEELYPHKGVPISPAEEKGLVRLQKGKRPTR